MPTGYITTRKNKNSTHNRSPTDSRNSTDPTVPTHNRNPTVPTVPMDSRSSTVPKLPTDSRKARRTREGQTGGGGQKVFAENFVLYL